MLVPLALLYHAVLAGVPAADRTLIVEPAELDWQLSELRRRGFRSLDLDGYHAALEAGDDDPFAVLLTFDDAYAHLFPRVSALLEKHAFTAAVFVPTAHIGGRNDWDGAEVPLHGHPIATVEALRGAAEGAWELAAHGLAHVDLRTLSPKERRRQLTAAREQVSELSGSDTVDLAYPYGASDEAVRGDARRAGYRMAFSAHAAGSNDRFALARVPDSWPGRPQGVQGQDRARFPARLRPGADMTALTACIVPCFNGERFLGAAIDSVLAQDHRPIEIVVVDDGSTDHSLAVAEAYGDPVRLIRAEHGGIAAARNTGILASHGEYLGFLDADDLYLPGKISAQVAVLEARPRDRLLPLHRRELLGGGARGRARPLHRAWQGESHSPSRSDACPTVGLRPDRPP